MSQRIGPSGTPPPSREPTPRIGGRKVTWLQGLKTKITQLVRNILGYEHSKTDLISERERISKFKEMPELNKRADEIANKLPKNYKVAFGKGESLNSKMKKLEKNLENLRIHILTKKDSLPESDIKKFDDLASEYNKLAKEYNDKIISRKKIQSHPVVEKNPTLEKTLNKLERKMINAGYIQEDSLNQESLILKLGSMNLFLNLERKKLEESSSTKEKEKFNEIVNELKSVEGVDEAFFVQTLEIKPKLENDLDVLEQKMMDAGFLGENLKEPNLEEKFKALNNTLKGFRNSVSSLDEKVRFNDLVKELRNIKGVKIDENTIVKELEIKRDIQNALNKLEEKMFNEGFLISRSNETNLEKKFETLNNSLKGFRPRIKNAEEKGLFNRFVQELRNIRGVDIDENTLVKELE